MTDHFAEQIAQALVKENLLHEDAVPLATQALCKAFLDQIESIWTLDDVRSCAEDENGECDLGDDVLREILWQIEREEDAEYGINWDVIHQHIDWYREDVKDHPSEQR